MATGTQSIAPSEATTLVDGYVSMPEQRTTLLGRPIEQKHDHFTNVMMSDGAGGFGTGSAVANLLPPGYTDRSLVRIPIKMSDVDPSEVKPAKKGGFLRKLSDGLAAKSNPGDEIKVIMMSRGDYLKYWVKGEDGKFAPSVEEPPDSDVNPKICRFSGYVQCVV